MQFLHESLVELITQTSTNLPPDVRAAMGLAERHPLGRQRFPGGRENSRERLGDGEKRILVHRGLHIIATAELSSFGHRCAAAHGRKHSHNRELRPLR